MDDKLIPLVEENKNLKIKVEKLEKAIEFLKKVEKKNNIIIFGLEEKKTSTFQLLQGFKEHLKQDLNITIEHYEINKIYRLGTKNREIRTNVFDMIRGRAELASNQPKKPRPRHDLFNTKLGKHQVEQITIALIDKFTDYESNTKEFGTRGRYNWIENTIKTQIQLIANTKTEPKKWLTTNATKLLEARNHLDSTKDTQDRRKNLTEISKQIIDSIRKDRKQNRMETIETFISKTGGIKKAYRELRNSKDWIVKMKNDSGKWNNRRTGILDIATSYYKRLYESNTTEDEIDLADTSNIPNILQAEVEKAIDTQKVVVVSTCPYRYV
ncbi:unnamed protein product [Parnassius apollo]|uniref:(apollo) hypothetical protein n=1 Tax=Parnassius apollo TaxID=110799 RepID=A0A8S3XD23_PARAO|nr:unnamed protein product [Parnassius apollo]